MTKRERIAWYREAAERWQRYAQLCSKVPAGSRVAVPNPEQAKRHVDIAADFVVAARRLMDN